MSGLFYVYAILYAAVVVLKVSYKMKLTQLVRQLRELREYASTISDWTDHFYLHGLSISTFSKDQKFNLGFCHL